MTHRNAEWAVIATVTALVSLPYVFGFWGGVILLMVSALTLGAVAGLWLGDLIVWLFCETDDE